MRRELSDQTEEASGVLIVVGVAVLVLSTFVIVWQLLHRPTPRPGIRQKAQLHSMDAATELFNNEFGSYPPSDANDPTGKPYCGAMKLAEALMGLDLLGCHAKSVFRRDGLDAAGTSDLYPDDIEKLDSALRAESLKARMGPYLAFENAGAVPLSDIYGKGNTGPFPEDTYVLCDTYEQERSSGKKTGMPILYYRANRLGKTHRAGDPNNIYDCRDNLALLALGVPGQPGKTHSLIDPNRFYLNTQNVRVASSPQPVRPDSYILISAGWDGLYGTADDVCNFDWRYRQQ
jgi:hypothetical protein